VTKLGEPAMCGPDFSYITCLRCKTHVCIKDTGSSVKLIYDTKGWQQSDCRCLHLEGPVSCCSFADLKRIINELGVAH
jgi:hypothetical protein